jgi:perosamine synthetase
MFRLSIPSIGREEELAVSEVLKSGFFVQGKKVAQFEEAVAAYLGVKHAVAVNSGTSALHVALLAMGIGPGDEVILPDYTFPATVNVVELTGAKPVIVDIEPNTYNMDPRQVEAAVTPRTRAIMPVHLFGQSADLDPILKVAQKHKLQILEDAACVLGARYKGRLCGTIGDAGCFSFHPRKIITTGEGGMVVTDKPAIAERLRILRNHGMEFRPNTNSIDFVAAGFNYRMTEMNAAIGLVQMKKLSKFIAGRQKVAREYDRRLKKISWIKTPVTPKTNTHMYQAYIVHVDPSVNRDRLMGYLKSHGIEVNFGTYALHRLSFYKTKYRLQAGRFPAAEDAFKTTLALPLYERLTKHQIHAIADVIGKFR